jgi:Asp-tRNA(Asn)/Glu-tRNA(Gln) amidotransferase C subunit
VPYTLETSPAIRDDEWQPYPDPEEILAQAPETEEGYIVVPEIPHQEL